ncbi:MAG: lysophospholipase L1-like esterase [Planctomycetota bacterium]
MCAAEVVVRVLELGPGETIVFQENYRLSTNPILEYELVPGSADYATIISSAGLRDREFEDDKPDDTFRIAFVGDSVTFGLGFAPNVVFCKQLEGFLNSCATSPEIRFEVLNFGVTGYNIPQVVEQLRTRGTRFTPDLVIYGYVLNDAQSYSVERASLEQMHAEALGQSSAALPEFAQSMLSRSQLYRLSEEAWATPTQEPDLMWMDPTADAFRANSYQEYFTALHSAAPTWERVVRGFSDLASISEETGVPVAIAIFPIHPKDRREHYPLQSIHDQVAKLAATHNFPCLDLVDAFDAARGSGYRVLFIDPLHLDAEGHVVAALALLDWIDRSGLAGTLLDATELSSAADILSYQALATWGRLRRGQR